MVVKSTLIDDAMTVDHSKRRRADGNTRSCIGYPLIPTHSFLFLHPQQTPQHMIMRIRVPVVLSKGFAVGLAD
jgi:hypothetical protein